MSGIGCLPSFCDVDTIVPWHTADRAQITPPPRNDRGSILLVDDEPQLLRSIARLLGARGAYDVLTAEHSAAAFEQLSANIDLVLLDLQLADGDLDGIACLREMRARGFGGPICILSGHGEPANVCAAVEAGADGFLVKPCEDLLGAVAELLVPDPITESHTPGLHRAGRAYLRSKGVNDDGVALLASWVERFFPDLKWLAGEIGVNEDALDRRFVRLRRKLGQDNLYRLAALLTALCLLGASRTARPRRARMQTNHQARRERCFPSKQ
jgi:CheY-like chemotaxis protein